MGSVYKVLDTSTNRLAALKMLAASTAAEPGFRERFAREIQLLAKLAHPAIPRVLGAGVAGVPFFVSDFVEGETLRALIDRAGSLSAERTAEIGAAVAEALAFAHAHGVIHRDVKPHNIMIDRRGTVFLIDFGIARAGGPDMRSLTETGMLLGTPHYMAPEQLESHRVDERSDIYSLGVVLFEAVTGTVPFDGDTPFSVGRKHVQNEPPRPRERKPGIPPSLETIILRCLAKNAARRPWSATELAALLRKPHRIEVRRRRMPNGDRLEEAPPEIVGYALRILSRHPKKDWTEGMALHFEGVLYELSEILESPPDHEYRFVHFPPEEILRRLVDYDVEAITESRQISPVGWLKGLWKSRATSFKA